MSIIVNNTDNQLNIDNNGILDVYAVRSIKSVSKAIDASGNYYIAINFIANDKNNSLRINLKDVSSPAGWTNDLGGANNAIKDLRDWLGEIIEVEISEANDSILIYGFDGANNQPVSVDANGQVDINVHDGSGTSITSTTVGGDTGLDVNIIGGVTLEVNLDQNNDQVQVYGSDLTSPIKTDATGVLAIQDNGGSITVDGTVSLSAGSLSALESITVQNPGGASAVNIQDGGNSITVDGTVAATQSGTWSIGVTNAAGASAVNIQDGGNSITVDGGTGVQRTPTISRVSASSSVAAGAYSVSFASVGTANATVGGVTLKPGETISFDGGAINNTLGSISYDSSAAGAELLIIKLT